MGWGSGTGGRALLALIALAVGTFAIGTTEFVITGVLPEVAHDLDTSIATAGLLISGYALGVVVGAPVMTAIASRVPRKPMLLVLLVLFVAGNVLCAVSTSFLGMLLGRVVASLCHGAYIGIATVVAAQLVPPHRKASAIAAMLTGLTVSNVAGVPLGTFLGQQAGWRATFWTIAVLGVLAILAIVAWVPAVTSEPVALRVELAAFRRVRVWLALLTTALGFGALYAPFTYVAGLMARAGFGSATLPWLLVLFGVGLVVGNAIGARAADRRLRATVIVTIALLAGVLLAFYWTGRAEASAAVTLLLIGLIGFATVPGLTALVLAEAGDRAGPAGPAKATDSPPASGSPGDADAAATDNTMAASAACAAFNVGNATGAYLASRVVAAGLGFAPTTLVGAAMGAAAVVVAVIAARWRKSPDRAAERGAAIAVE